MPILFKQHFSVLIQQSHVDFGQGPKDRTSSSLACVVVDLNNGFYMSLIFHPDLQYRCRTLHWTTAKWSIVIFFRLL